MGAKLLPDPSAAMLNLSALAYLLGVSAITWCITRTTERYSLLAKKTWTTIPWARICLLLALVVAWLYLTMTGVLLHGAPRQHESHRCSIAIIMCLICYCVNKALVYLCLIERVRAVWNTSQQRWRSPVYLFCLSLLLPVIGTLAGLLIPQATHYVYSGYCIIGISHPSSIFLIAYDIFINLFLTGMFVVPLVRARIRSAWLRTVAIRSIISLSAASPYTGLYMDLESRPILRLKEYTGVSQPSSSFLIAYDVFLNLFLTGMFVVPLVRAKIRSVWLRTVAIRSIVATLIALLTTSVNCAVSNVLDGSEAIWICLGGCAVDIAIGSVVLYWALHGPGESSNSEAKGVYLSPIGDIPTFQPAAFESIAGTQDRSTVSHNPPHPDNRSETTVAVSDVCIPSLEKPKPAIQNDRYQVLFVQDPPRKRLTGIL
ncbi:unnamed protein product [Rhizoctonia solani]|uniref:Uncharacterized protein n=1 Tax=Rhizoctonia solani TaxID=456999 RepID=A0A8H3G930_9AGAM|nr:unnamed protein product [Rhizoctonia solani]